MEWCAARRTISVAAVQVEIRTKKLRTVKSDPFEIETTNVRSVELKHLWDTSEVLPEQ